jgi:hypothetical protein
MDYFADSSKLKIIIDEGIFSNYIVSDDKIALVED